MPATLKKIVSRVLNDTNYREIIFHSSANFLVRIGGIIAGYLLILFISRTYGPEILGSYTISITVLMIFAVLGRLGMDTAIIKHFAAAFQQNNWDLIKEVYIKSLQVMVPACIVLSVVFYFSAGFISEHIFHKPQLESYLKIVSFAVLPMVMRFVTAASYRGFKKIALYGYYQNVGTFLYAIVILGILTLDDKNALYPNIAFLTSLIILMLTGGWSIFSRIKKHSNNNSEQHSHKELFHFALPMMLTGSILLISGWINTIMLGIFSTETNVGVYSVILKIATLSSFILLSINSIVAPRFAQLHSSNDIEGLKKYSRQTAKVIFFSSMPIFILILLLRSWLLEFFGPEFITGSTALVIIMGGQYFNFFAGSVGHYLNMTGRQDKMRNIVAVCAFFNVILCYILIPIYGLIGSAIANAVFMASWNIWAMIYIKVKFGVRTYYWPAK